MKILLEEKHFSKHGSSPLLQYSIVEMQWMEILTFIY